MNLPGISKILFYFLENWFLAIAWLCWIDGPTSSWETLATSGGRETAMRHLPPSVQTAYGTAGVVYMGMVKPDLIVNRAHAK